MDVFALLFILSFITLLITLVVMSIRKSINKGKGDFKEEVETIVENTYFETTGDFTTKFNFGSSIDKWKKSLPHPSTRLKNRNKRKGKKKWMSYL